MRQLNKKGAGVTDLAGALLGFIVVAVVAVVSFLINGKLQDYAASSGGVNTSDYVGTGGTWTSAYNSTRTVNTSMKTVTDFLPLIAVVLIGGFIIAYLVRGFGAKSGGV